MDADFDVPSGRCFIALLQAFRAARGTAPGEIVGRLLEEHQLGHAVSLAQLINTGQAFGLEWRDILWIQMFQFDADDLALKASARVVRAELPSMWSLWQLASWFAAPNAGLDGLSPADVLDSDLVAVMRVARSLPSVEGFSLPLGRRALEVAAHV